MTDKPTYHELEQRVRKLEIAESERKRTEEDLRESEEKHRILLESAPFGMALIDRRGSFTYVNPKFTEIFGYDLAHVPDGRTWFRKAYPDEEDRRKAISLWIADTKDAKPGELIPRIFSVTCLNGTKRVVNIITSILFSSDYLMTCEDITERKMAEEALRESEEKYRRIYENSVVGFFQSTPEGRFLDVNHAFAKMLGYESPKVLVSSVSDIASQTYSNPKDRSRYHKTLQAHGYVEDFELKVRRKDGSEVWLSDSSRAYFDEGGKAVRYEGIVVDITERKMAEEALWKSEQRYRKILESIADGYYEVDLAGDFTFFNDSVCELLGYSRDELMGMNNRQYTDEHGAKKLFRTFNEVYRTGKSTKVFGWEVIRKDQARRFVEASVTLMKDEKCKPSGFRGIVRDISERKRAEEDRKKLQAQLSQAQKMESIGILAGGIAHNFNNVLMGIQGRASLMMMDTGPSSPDYEHLKGIKEYVKGATELTRDLLGFARGGKYEVKPADMNTLIKHENRMFGRTKKELRVQGKYEKDLWTVEVDPGQMRQALLNLYVNAWQAMPGGGDLYVQTENVRLDQEYVKPFAINPGRYVKISVTDTGIGMDDATLEKVFDPFFSTKDIGQGSGLGLASVYGIIKNHGGFINVYSEKGIGSAFTIYLPASEKEAVEETRGNDRHQIQYGQGTVLLVDDEDMIVDVGKEMLERLGYQVLIAKSGWEALDIYKSREKNIHLVILDMIMPGMGGGEVFDKLREMDRNVKVLLSSGYSINGQAKEIMDRGCGGFIQKPFTMEELSRKVKEADSGNRGSPGTTRHQGLPSRPLQAGQVTRPL